jgi:hypothetical protein
MLSPIIKIPAKGWRVKKDYTPIEILCEWFGKIHISWRIYELSEYLGFKLCSSHRKGNPGLCLMFRGWINHRC